jgi:uncharacterized membrane protein
MADSWKVSLVWGRVGAAVMAIVAMLLGFFGYQMGAEEQSQVVELGTSILAGLAGVLALVSKIREGIKAKKATA